MTLRHELFCQEYASSLDERKAMLAVGLKPRSPSLLDANEEVQERVAELVAQRITRLQLTGDWLLVQLSKNALEARENGEYHASNGALKIMAELIGMIGPRSKPVSPGSTLTFGGKTNGEDTSELAGRSEYDGTAE